MKLNTSVRGATGILLLVALCACGTVMHGARQDLEVQSSPAGATVQTSPSTGTFTTPTTLSLERKKDYVLTFTAPGYAPAQFNVHNSIGTGTVIADVLLTGLVGVVVDGLTGAWYGLTPEAATVTLTKTTAAVGPDAIRLHVVKSSDGRGIAITSDDSTDAVHVSVQQR